MSALRVLITGANGQVGWELQRSVPQGVEMVAVDRTRLDLTDGQQVDQLAAQVKPAIIINAAAYTAVDKAESEPELAFAVNRDGAANIARAAAKQGARLIHISTDFVFDGRQSTPYLPTDAPNPINIYGASKLAGERVVMDISAGSAVIVRTAWVYSEHGNNFVKTMLRLMRERDEVRVVCDQIGTPTWAKGLADVLWLCTKKPEMKGIYHWTDSGVASWYDFAIAIQEEALNCGLHQRSISLHPINTEGYPTPARRPAFSVMDKQDLWKLEGCVPRHWRSALHEMVARTFPKQ